MPKQNVDYSKTVIYKIVCNDLNVKDVYIGSTTDFTRRKYKHKNSSTNANLKAYNLKLYQFIRNNGGWYNWSMIEIQKYPCNDRREAELRERHYYELYNANLNTRYPSRTQKEWVEENKDYFKDYYKNNIDKIKEKINCDCGGIYTYLNKQRHMNSIKHQDFIKSQQV